MTERPSTYLDHARAEADQLSGRFAKQTSSRVIGVPEYPRQPPTSHWAIDPVPAEPPLNVDVNAVPDLGFNAARPTTNSGEADPTVSPPFSVETETSPNFLKRRV